MPPPCSYVRPRPLRPHAVPPPPLPSRIRWKRHRRTRSHWCRRSPRRRSRYRAALSAYGSAASAGGPRPPTRPSGLGPPRVRTGPVPPQRDRSPVYEEVPTSPSEPAVPRPPTPTSPGVAATPPAGGGRGLAVAAVAGTALLLVAAIGWWALSRRHEADGGRGDGGGGLAAGRVPRRPGGTAGDHGRRDGRGARRRAEQPLRLFLLPPWRRRPEPKSPRGHRQRCRRRRPWPPRPRRVRLRRPPPRPSIPCPASWPRRSRPWPRSATATRSRDSTTC